MAAASLQEGLALGKSLADEAAALRAASSGDRVIAAALNALPDGAFDRKGLPTRLALERRFDRAVAEARKAAMVPQDGGVMGHLMGSFFSGLLMGSGAGSASASNGGSVSGGGQGGKDTNGEEGASTPSLGARAAAAAAALSSGAVATGDGSAQGVMSAVGEQNSDLSRSAQHVMHCLDRAEAALAAGDMSGAASALGHVDGYAGSQVEGVRAAFLERLRAEQGARLVRAHVRVLTASMY